MAGEGEGAECGLVEPSRSTRRDITCLVCEEGRPGLQLTCYRLPQALPEASSGASPSHLATPHTRSGL